MDKIKYNNEEELEWFIYNNNYIINEPLNIKNVNILMQVKLKNGKIRDILIQTENKELISLEILIMNKKGLIPDKKNISKHINYLEKDIEYSQGKYLELVLITDFILDFNYKKRLIEYGKRYNCSIKFIQFKNNRFVVTDKIISDRKENKLMLDDIIEFYPNIILQQIRTFFLKGLNIKTFHNWDSLKGGTVRCNAGKDSRRFEYNIYKIELKDSKHNFQREEAFYYEIIRKFKMWKFNKNRTGIIIYFEDYYKLNNDNRVIFMENMYKVRDIIKKTYNFIIANGN